MSPTQACSLILPSPLQGHLSRFLAFSLGLSVTAVEGDGRLVSLAEHFDQELLRELEKAQARGYSRRLPPSQRHPNTTPDPTDPASLCPRRPQHVAGWLDPQAPGQEFLLAPTPGPALAARNPLAGPVDSEQVLLTGLHACGDLSVALLRHFAHSPQVAAVTSAACCYMKLSTCPEPTASSLLGYPLSTWVAGLPGHTLSYRAREAACHAVEEYTERLRRDSECLRIHCYRAVLETLIQAADPSKKHLGVQTVKKAHTLSFPECVWGGCPFNPLLASSLGTCGTDMALTHRYARLGLTLVGLDSAAVPLDSESVCAMLCQQHKVVAFFSLVLLLAPLVETLILLDRLLYLREQGGCWQGRGLWSPAGANHPFVHRFPVCPCAPFQPPVLPTQPGAGGRAGATGCSAVRPGQGHSRGRRHGEGWSGALRAGAGLSNAVGTDGCPVAGCEARATIKPGFTQCEVWTEQAGGEGAQQDSLHPDNVTQSCQRAPQP